MTCIIGVLDKENDCVYIGADSLGSSNYYKQLFKNKKVFKAKDNKNVLMAICGDYKLENILSVEEGLIDEIKELKDEVNFEHIVKHTSPKIFNLAEKYNCVESNNGYKTIGGSIIFAYKNKLYSIESNGQVLEPVDDYLASGSGIMYALGALVQNQNKDIIKRIQEGLEAAEKHAMGVERPFYIMNTKNDDVIEIK